MASKGALEQGQTIMDLEEGKSGLSARCQMGHWIILDHERVETDKAFRKQRCCSCNSFFFNQQLNNPVFTCLIP